MEHLLRTYIISDTIISSLGFGTEENLKAIQAYHSGITSQQENCIANSSLPAATISSERLQQHATLHGLENFTRMEQLFILSIKDVLKQSGANLQDKSCGLILSTTKGNIDLLSEHTTHPDDSVFLWKMAEKIVSHFWIGKQVHVISNACISGVSALIAGKRMIESGIYKKVVIAGGDVLSHFITSGFLSFKSISPQQCRPYDAQRDGLNLGEACGAVILSSEGTENDILLSGGSISNDANHISGPSRTGDGLFLAIEQAMEEAGTETTDISFINSHGTATVYNDEMEAKAFSLAHLENVPVHSLKPYFGHTLGASGIIEAIICVHELKTNYLFGTLGYKESGVSIPVQVCAEHRNIPMQHCLKTASGFGGCNAAIVLSLPLYKKEIHSPSSPSIHITNSVVIENRQITVNGKNVFRSQGVDFGIFIREAYKNFGENNMKFYKMDDLCKLGYIAAGYLLKGKTFSPVETGILLANASSSLNTDIKHQEIIDTEGESAASPAIFVYTLPNVVSGEICIHHKIQGENTFFIEKEYKPKELEEYARVVMKKGNLKYCIIGWCDLLKEQYKADFKLIERI